MNQLCDWYKARVRPPGWYGRVATLIVERECLGDAIKLVDPEYRSQLVDGFEVPTTIDSTIWIQVLENEI